MREAARSRAAAVCSAQYFNKYRHGAGPARGWARIAARRRSRPAVNRAHAARRSCASDLQAAAADRSGAPAARRLAQCAKSDRKAPGTASAKLASCTHPGQTAVLDRGPAPKTGQQLPAQLQRAPAPTTNSHRPRPRPPFAAAVLCLATPLSNPKYPRPIHPPLWGQRQPDWRESPRSATAPRLPDRPKEQPGRCHQRRSPTGSRRGAPPRGAMCASHLSLASTCCPGSSPRTGRTAQLSALQSEMMAHSRRPSTGSLTAEQASKRGKSGLAR
jgi:hypothetical protein